MAHPEHTVHVQAHGMRWTCAEDFASTLPRVDVERAWLGRRLPQDQFVKQSTVRTVMRAADPDRPDGPGLFVKWYRLRGLRDRLKHLFVPTKAEVEWRVAAALSDADVSTCRVLAYAVGRGEAFLVSRAIPDSEPLVEFLLRGPEPKVRDEVLGELATLTAALVDAGFTHRDYHGGNVVIRPDAPAGQRLYVLDLHSICLRPPSRRGLTRMLVMLGPALGATHGAFLRQFLEAWRGGPGPAGFEEWTDRLQRARLAFRRRHVRSRTRRCLLRSSLFTIERAGGYLLHRRRDFPVEVALESVRRHRQVVDSGETVLRKGRRTEVTIVPAGKVPDCAPNQPAAPEEVGPGRVCVKAFRRDAWAERLKDLMRPRGRARSAWVAHRLYKVTGIPAPRPIALLEAGPLGGRPDYLITEAIGNEGNLFAFVTGRELGGKERTALGRAVAALMRQMADAEVYHPDTKPTNFLVSRVGDGFGLHLVDLDRSRHGVRYGPRLWARCLMKLNAGLPDTITLLDRMRCLRECGRGRWSARERLELARQVLKLSLERRAKGPR